MKEKKIFKRSHICSCLYKIDLAVHFVLLLLLITIICSSLSTWPRKIQKKIFILLCFSSIFPEVKNRSSFSFPNNLLISSDPENLLHKELRIVTWTNKLSHGGSTGKEKDLSKAVLFWLSIFFQFESQKTNMVDLDFELYTPKFTQIDLFSRENVVFNF